MDIQDRFTDAWKRRYPDSDCPKLGCFGSHNTSQNRGVELEVGGAGLYEKLSNESHATLARIHRLRDQLEKEEFVYHFLLSQLDLYQSNTDRKSSASLGNFATTAGDGRGSFRPRANSGSSASTTTGAPRTSLSTSSLPQPSRFVRVGSESEARGRALRNSGSSSDKFRAPNRILSFRLSRSPDIHSEHAYQNSQKLLGQHGGTDADINISLGKINSLADDNNTTSLCHDIVSTEKSSICYVKPSVSRSHHSDSQTTSYVDNCIVAESGTALTVSIEGGVNSRSDNVHSYVMDRVNKGSADSTVVVPPDKVGVTVQVSSLAPTSSRKTSDRTPESGKKPGNGMKDSSSSGGSMKSRPVPKPKPSVKGPAVRSRGLSSTSSASSLSPHTELDSEDATGGHVSATSSNITLKSLPPHQLPVTAPSSLSPNEPHVVIINKKSETESRPLHTNNNHNNNGKQAIRQEEVGGGLMKSSPVAPTTATAVATTLSNTRLQQKQTAVSSSSFNPSQVNSKTADRNNSINNRPTDNSGGGGRGERESTQLGRDSNLLSPQHQDQYVNINIQQVQEKYGVPKNWDVVDSAVSVSHHPTQERKMSTTTITTKDSHKSDMDKVTARDMGTDRVAVGGSSSVSSNNNNYKTEESDGTSVDSGIGHCTSNLPGDAENIEEDISPYGCTFAAGPSSRMTAPPQNSNPRNNVSFSSGGGAASHSNNLNKTSTPPPFLSTFGKTSPSTDPSIDALYSNSSIPKRKRSRPIVRHHNYEEVNVDAMMDAVIGSGSDRESASNSPLVSPIKEPIYAEPTPLLLRQQQQQQQRSDSASGGVGVRPLSPFNKNSSLKKNLPESPLVKQRSFDSHHAADSDDNGEPFDKPVSSAKNKTNADCSSSDDEEPIYYNLMLLKKETLRKQQTLRKTVIDDSVIYQSVDFQKKLREREKKQAGAKTNAAMSPYYCNNVSANNSSISEGDESRDSVFLRQDSSPQSPMQTANKSFRDSPEWRKRQSMLMATHSRGSATSLDSFDMPPLDATVSSSSSATDRADKQHIRKCVVMGILDSEHLYVDCLDVLLQYMRSLQAAAKSSQPVISNEDVSTIFFQIPALYDLHMEFVRKLEPIVEKWNAVNADQSVGVIFKEMAVQLPIAGEYIHNYPKAIATVKKCAQNSVQFQELTKAIKTKGINEALSLQELLHKPLVRVQRNSLVLHDLIKCTPTAHTDYDMLQKALKISQYFLENLTLPQYEGIDKEFQRYLVKNSLIVELSSSKRRLRHVFLYNDLLVCAKQRVTRQKFHYDVKWFIPIPDLKLDMSSESVDGKLCNTDEVDSLRKRLKTAAESLRKEVTRQKKAEEQNKDKNWMFRNNTKNIEKLKKKLAELESQLVLASPSLKFCLLDGADRRITFLMSSDYERNEWRDTIQVLQAKRPLCPTLTVDEVAAQINGCKQLPKMNNLGSFFVKDDTALEDEILNGVLTVTIHKLHGLREACDIFCCMEVDSYGQFSIKAKTNLICGTTEPTWNEGFEIDLESSQTLRLMCYKREYDQDIVLGKCALELNRAWLRGEFTEKIITLNEEVSLTVSLSFTSREQTLRRMPSNVKTGVFGVPIKHLTKREITKVPLIVSACVEEIEKRGMDEVGIYRLSGLSSEIQRLKKAFDKNSRAAVQFVKDVDVNVTTGLLKLYFRELPEALFTDRLYHSFVDGMELADPEAKQNCMLSLFKSLPEPNHTTALYLMTHLAKISQSSHINKMNLNNLSTVFGPTLLRPATKNDSQILQPMDFFAGAQDAQMQSTILFYFLSLYSRGCSFEAVTSAF